MAHRTLRESLAYFESLQMHGAKGEKLLKTASVTAQCATSATADGWHCAPSADACTCTSGRMSRTCVGNPARRRLFTTPMPIAPAPITPTGKGALADDMRYFAGGGIAAYGSQSRNGVGTLSITSVSSLPLPRSSRLPLL